MTKRPDFTPQELELLRAYAREIRDHRTLTGEKLGELMESSQQTASAFTKPGSGSGIGRIAANALARNTGFRDSEECLSWLRARRAIQEGGELVGNVWSQRDTARKIAEAMGVAAAAIDAVIGQRKANEDARRPVKWWVLQFTLQETQMAADEKLNNR